MVQCGEDGTARNGIRRPRSAMRKQSNDHSHVSCNWDSRTNSLTFNTFRPTSPERSPAVSGVTRDMLNGTLSSRRQTIQSRDSAFPQLSAAARHHGAMGQKPSWPLPKPIGLVVPNCDSFYAASNLHARNDRAICGLQDPRLCTLPKVIRNYQELLIEIQLTSDEFVLGFTMISKRTEDSSMATLEATRVYHVIPGSAASRAGLQSDDEILEINDISIMTWTHEDVLKLIHHCLKAKSVRLKVRRQLNAIASISSSSQASGRSSISSSASASVSGGSPEAANFPIAPQQCNGQATILRDDHSVNAKVIGRNWTDTTARNNYYRSASIPHRSQPPPLSRKPSSAPVNATRDGAPIGMPVIIPPRPLSNGHHHHNHQPSAEMRILPSPPANLSTHSNTPPAMAQWRNSVSTSSGSAANYVAVTRSESRETSFSSSNSGSIPPKPPPLPPKGRNYYGSANNNNGKPELIEASKEDEVRMRNCGGGSNVEGRMRRFEDERLRSSQQRVSREEDFYRTTIRTSKTLHSLEKGPAFPNSHNGHTNGAFVNDRDEEDAYNRMPDLTKDITNEKRLYRPRARSSSTYGMLQKRSSSIAGLSAVDLANVLVNVHQTRRSDTCNELKSILSKPVFRALMQTHDDIFKSPSNPEPKHETPTTDGQQQSWSWGTIETPLDEASGNLRIVKLYKNGDNPLVTNIKPMLFCGSFQRSSSVQQGATVVQEGKAIAIGRIIKGGVAEKSGLVKEGDELLEVNGIDLRNKSVHEVCELLANMRGELIFIIAPKPPIASLLSDHSTQESQTAVKHLRALFDYDPEEDYYLPCRELGLNFRKGDILHVLSMTDTNWWQAHRDGEQSNVLAGLIPSSSFQIQRECCRMEKNANTPRAKGQRNLSVDRATNGGSAGGALWCAGRRKDKKRSTSVFVSDGRKIASISINGERSLLINHHERTPREPLDVQTYEEVTLHLSKTGRKRPIVLVAPAYVGHRHLLQKVMEMKTETFAKVVYHTSRPKQANEQDGARYYFLNRQQFLEYVNQKRFVEWGEYDKHYYGTSYDSIRRVVDQGKTCVLTLKPQSLKSIRTAEFRPYIVYVSPPPFECLKTNAQRDAARSGKPCPKDEELRNIINEAGRIEEKFGHLFDKTLISFDLETCSQELIGDLQRLEIEPQWVPAVWLQ